MSVFHFNSLFMISLGFDCSTEKNHFLTLLGSFGKNCLTSLVDCSWKLEKVRMEKDDATELKILELKGPQRILNRERNLGNFS